MNDRLLSADVSSSAEPSGNALSVDELVSGDAGDSGSEASSMEQDIAMKAVEDLTVLDYDLEASTPVPAFPSSGLFRNPSPRVLHAGNVQTPGKTRCGAVIGDEFTGFMSGLRFLGHVASGVSKLARLVRVCHS